MEGKSEQMQFSALPSAAPVFATQPLVVGAMAMALQNRNVEQPSTHRESSRGNGGSKLLSTLALLLSTLALLSTGFTLFQILQLRQQIGELKNSVSGLSAAPNQIYPAQVPNPATTGGNTALVNPPVGTTSTSAPVKSPALNTTAGAPSGSTGIQPGQFVGYAFGNKGQVELLRVKRIPGQLDVVNVQIRIRVLRPQTTSPRDSMHLHQTTARNPQTSETYEAVRGESTGYVSLSSLKSTSADAYVWLQVPEGVNTIDIYVPDTEAFTNVPISS